MRVFGDGVLNLLYVMLCLEARIIGLNASYFLKVGGHVVMSIKV